MQGDVQNGIDSPMGDGYWLDDATTVPGSAVSQGIVLHPLYPNAAASCHPEDDRQQQELLRYFA